MSLKEEQEKEDECDLFHGRHIEGVNWDGTKFLFFFFCLLGDFGGERWVFFLDEVGNGGFWVLFCLFGIDGRIWLSKV